MDIDHRAVSAIDAELAPALESADDLVLDLSEVTYLGSAGVSLLFRAASALGARGRRLSLVSPPATISRHVMDLCGIATAADVIGGEPPASSAPPRVAAGGGTREGAAGQAPDADAPHAATASDRVS